MQAHEELIPSDSLSTRLMTVKLFNSINSTDSFICQASAEAVICGVGLIHSID